MMMAPRKRKTVIEHDAPPVPSSTYKIGNHLMCGDCDHMITPYRLAKRDDLTCTCCRRHTAPTEQSVPVPASEGPWES